MHSVVNMRVILDKNVDKDVFDTMKTKILYTFIWEKTIKIGFGQNYSPKFL